MMTDDEYNQTIELFNRLYDNARKGDMSHSYHVGLLEGIILSLMKRSITNMDIRNMLRAELGDKMILVDG